MEGTDHSLIKNMSAYLSRTCLFSEGEGRGEGDFVPTNLPIAVITVELAMRY